MTPESSIAQEDTPNIEDFSRAQDRRDILGLITSYRKLDIGSIAHNSKPRDLPLRYRLAYSRLLHAFFNPNWWDTSNAALLPLAKISICGLSSFSAAPFLEVAKTPKYLPRTCLCYTGR
ncbi:hypothetical protein WG66_006068 [Moniliophthora roreri]|nr:hypothetical protein WG66_006068 [Moniliophthora roreri]